MRTAWVLPGGSTFGAIQAGLVTALFEAGIEPEMVLGTSAGSLNAAWLAGDPSSRGAEKLRELWNSMRRRDVFPIQPVRILAGKLGLSNSLMSSHGLARWVHRTLPYRRIEHARIPLTITATDINSGDGVYFEHGPVLPALIASCSIPGMFPPVRIDDRWLVDGGPAAFMPISRAVEQGADRVYVLPCGGTEPFEPVEPERGVGSIATLPPPKKPPKSISGLNGDALGAAMASAARLDMQLNSTRCELHVLPAPSIHGLSPYSFAHSGALIEEAWRAARRWLPTATPVPPGPVDIGGNPVVATEAGVDGRGAEAADLTTR
ncbi:patatin-like phospholipase family protein [Haloactinomyces albus]|uniref:NTE family protein n=1 Tax=Haloactinomyces albus TaxID=1352928 RepID=A0AAE3ZCH0_9ACTN|nr:patatin-like phospholipase family protein [Haloactinomyces albus]MDR7301171.1 NTE family protein [Haloactinomyces albus]